MRCGQHSFCKAVAAVFCAAIAFVSCEASAKNSGRCFRFQYDADSVEIVSRCADWRRATIYWCDGRVLRIAIAGSNVIRVPMASGCPLWIVGEFGQDPSITPGRKPEKALKQATNGIPASAPSKPEQPRKQSGNEKASSPVAASDEGAKNAKDAGVALNFMGPISEPAANPSGAMPSQETCASEVKAELASRIQIAVFPEASKRDWNTLLCSASGELLTRETEALLDRKAALERLLRENRFSPDAPEKHEEWIAANKELQAIDRELRKFKERAKAVIGGTGLN